MRPETTDELIKLQHNESNRNQKARGDAGGGDVETRM
jgi:hypothetical protein